MTLFCSSKFPWARDRISSKFIEKIGQAYSKGFASPDIGTDRPHCTSDGDQYLDWRVGLAFVYSSGLPAHSTPEPKHVGDLYLSWIVLLSAFIRRHIEL
jgi:hypothetical protein